MNDKNDFPKKLFVGGLDYDTTDASLKEHFEQWGEVTNHHIVRFPETGDSKGFGFVTFRTTEMVDNCIDISHEIDGKEVDLRRVTDKKNELPRRAADKKNKLSNQTEPRRLFIGGLDYETTEEKLKEYFEKFGEVTQHNVVRFESGDSRGFGFVTFRYETSVEECMNKTGPHQIDGKTIEIKKVVSKEEVREGGGGSEEEEKFDPESKQMRKLFVGGMGYDVSEADLEAYFGRFGNLVETRVVKFPDSGKSRGFGFVMFEAAASVDECQKSRPHKLDGKAVETKRVTPKGDGLKGDTHITVKKIFIGGISDEIEDEHLEEYFGKFGKVEKVEQPRKPDSGRKRGFGFVEFEDSDTVDKIVLMPRFHQIGNRKLEIKKVLSKEQQAKAAGLESMPNMDREMGYMDFGMGNMGSSMGNMSGGMRNMNGGMGSMGSGIGGGMGNMSGGMGNFYGGMGNMRGMGGPMSNEMGTSRGGSMSAASSGDNNNTRLFVGGLNYETTDNTLKNYFQQFGKVTQYNVVKFPETGDSRGFGFVTFANPMMVQMCLNSGPHRIQGNMVELRTVQEKGEKNKQNGNKNKPTAPGGGMGRTSNVMSGAGRMGNMTGGMGMQRNEMGNTGSMPSGMGSMGGMTSGMGSMGGMPSGMGGMGGMPSGMNNMRGGAPNMGGGGLGHVCSGGNWCGGGFGNICGHDKNRDQGMQRPMGGPGNNMPAAGGIIRQDRGAREGPYSRMGQTSWPQRN